MALSHVDGAFTIVGSTFHSVDVMILILQILTIFHGHNQMLFLEIRLFSTAANKAEGTAVVLAK